jgi:hypothetical protein
MIGEKKHHLISAEFLELMNLDMDRLEVETETMISLQYQFEVQASDFIKFSEVDLQQGTIQGLVNALSNAKRAIDCQVDTVLGCFGLLSQRNFPQKMKKLGDLGMVAPRIVNKVVKARNYLEHEYKKPEKEQVEDAVDIATLFVISLDKALRNFWDSFIISTVVDRVLDEGHPFCDKWITVRYDEEKFDYELSGLIFDEQPTTESRHARNIAPIIIGPHDIGFVELVNLSFSLNNPVSDDEIKQRATQLIHVLSSNDV